MAMPSSWWSLNASASWRSGCRFKNDWSGADVYDGPSINRVICYDGDGIWQGVDSSMTIDSQWGAFHWVRQNGNLAGTSIPALGVAIGQSSQKHYPVYEETFSEGDIFPQVKASDGSHYSQRLLGFSSSDGTEPSDDTYYTVYYKPDYSGIEGQDTGDDSYCHLYHSQPPVYYGYPAQVISAIVMEAIDIDDYSLTVSDFIDTSSFDDSYDAQCDDTNGSQYGYPRDHPSLVAHAKYGEPIVDTLKRVSRHAWEYLGIGINTKLVYRHRSADAVAVVNSDHIIGNVNFSYMDDFLYNKIHMRMGVGRLIYNWDETPSDGPAPNLDGSGFAGGDTLTEDVSEDTSLQLLRSSTISESVTKYGERIVPGTEQDVDRALRFRTGDRRRTPPPSMKPRKQQPIQFLSHPYFNDIKEYQPCQKTSKYIEQLENESEPLRSAEITQDLYGLDYDVGHVVTVDGFTGQGDSWTAVCTNKSIDFNNLTVTSTLVERVG